MAARKQLDTINKADIAQRILQRYPGNNVIFVDDKLDNLKRAHSVYGNTAQYLEMTLHKAYPNARMVSKTTDSRFYEANAFKQIEF